MVIAAIILWDNINFVRFVVAIIRLHEKKSAMFGLQAPIDIAQR